MTLRDGLHAGSTDAMRTCVTQPYGIGSARFRARIEATARRYGTVR
jgi:hypothetical protein